MSIWKSLKTVAATALVLSVPALAVCVLTAGAPDFSTPTAKLHLVEPVAKNRAEQKAGSLAPVEEIDLRAYSFAYGSKPPPIQTTP